MKKYLIILLFLSGPYCSNLTARDYHGSSVFFIDNITVNDITYDKSRNLIYASVPSSMGFPYGNSVISVNPDNFEIVSSVYIGSEPNVIEISSDDSRIYVGVDGVNAFCWWEPDSNYVSQYIYLFSSGDPAVAMDIAVDPGNASKVVISKNNVGSSAEGDLELFENEQSLQRLNLVYGPSSIGFVSPTVLVGQLSAHTGFYFFQYEFNGSELTKTFEGSTAISGFSVRIKVSSGRVYSNSGIVIDGKSRGTLGTFSNLPSSPAVEPIEEDALVFFLGVEENQTANLALSIYDANNYLLREKISFGNIKHNISGVKSLKYIGNNKFAFITGQGSASQNTGLIGFIVIPEYFLEITEYISNADNHQLTWKSRVNQQYEIQWSNDLITWNFLREVRSSSGRTKVNFSTQTEPTTTRQFYRVHESQ